MTLSPGTAGGPLAYVTTLTGDRPQGELWVIDTGRADAGAGHAAADRAAQGLP